MAANLSITNVKTDGSALSFSVTGVLVSHAVYDLKLEAADDSLPDGVYHLQLWNNFTLVATTDQTYAEYLSSPSPSPSPPDWFDESPQITVKNGVGTGMLDLRTQEVEDLIMARERTSVTMTLYDSYNIYLPGRQGVQIIRNEAGLYLGDFEVQSASNSIIHGEKTFLEFPTTPEKDPVDPYHVTNKQYVLNLVADQITNAGGTVSIQTGINADLPAAGTAGRYYVETDGSHRILYDNGASWVEVARDPAQINSGDLGFDPATQAELDSHAGTAGAHHTKYTDTEAQTAINGDADHGSTASHNYASSPGDVGLVNVTNDEQVVDAGGTSSIQTGTNANLPTVGSSGRYYKETDGSKRVLYDNGASWVEVARDPAQINPGDLGFDPATQTELDHHAGQHTNGTDDIQSATSSQKGLATSAQASKINNASGVVVHGSDSTVARPAGFISVTWIGSVEPDNIENNDILIMTDSPSPSPSPGPSPSPSPSPSSSPSPV